MLLILGAGWTSTFLIPLLRSEKIEYAATSTSGRDDTIKFVFDPDSGDVEPYKALPDATVALITFPLKGHGPSEAMTDLYRKTHPAAQTRWIQLGSTGIFTAPHWNDHDSAYDRSNARAIAEDELLRLGGCVLNLAGLYGGSREPKNWLTRVAKTKEEVRAKKALHLIHGADVARAIVATYHNFTPAKRWLLTDLHVYDWWDLFMEWGDEVQEARRRSDGQQHDDDDHELTYRKWVVDAMQEDHVRALPRDAATLGRVLDATAFWSTMRTWPSVARVH